MSNSRRTSSRQTSSGDRKLRASMPIGGSSSIASQMQGVSINGNRRASDDSDVSNRSSRSSRADNKFRSSMPINKNFHRNVSHGSGHSGGYDTSERSGGSNKKSPSNSNSNSSSTPNPKMALIEWISSMKLPSGLLSSVIESYNELDSRLWLLDNSSSMTIRDAHAAKYRSSGAIDNIDVSRWQELYECVSFHAKMASKCWIPTKYWLINDNVNVGDGDGTSNHHKFNLCWGAYEDVTAELHHLKSVLKSCTLESKKCPLSSKLHSLVKGITKEAPNLHARDKRVTLVLCTQGLPTDSSGSTSSKLRREFQYELAAFGKLPVKVIVRLTTDNEKVRDMFNAMDSRFDGIDVLDDFWGEAMEVYLHNPWLTYGMGIHRLREAGLAPEVFDDLDESPLSLDEIHELCTVMFVGDDDLINLPHPQGNWNIFMRALKVLIEKEPTQWNPIKKKMTPWINLAKLDRMHGDPEKRCSVLDHRATARQGRQQKRCSFSGPSRQDPPEEQGSSSPSSRPTRSRHTFASFGSKAANGGASSSSKPCPKISEDGIGMKDLTLEEFIKRQWSHKPSDYKAYHSLGHLLVTVPNIFPPNNPQIDYHMYFTNWKTLDEDAFTDVSGDELKELLKRAARKAKFFLHPDKLPKDLNENQTILFKTIWDVLQDREAATF